MMGDVEIFAGREPIMIDAANPDKEKSIGKTDLSEAALILFVERQHKVIAQFIDIEDGRWYCFYRTYRGLAGREPGNHCIAANRSRVGIFQDSRQVQHHRQAERAVIALDHHPSRWQGVFRFPHNRMGGDDCHRGE